MQSREVITLSSPQQLLVLPTPIPCICYSHAKSRSDNTLQVLRCKATNQTFPASAQPRWADRVRAKWADPAAPGAGAGDGDGDDAAEDDGRPTPYGKGGHKGKGKGGHKGKGKGQEDGSCYT